jgi:hypothetical protein
MLFSNSEDGNLTLEDKVNYIYTELRKWERERLVSSITKWLWRGAIFGGLLYTYLFPASLFNTAKMITDQIMPSSQSLLQDLPSDISKEVANNPEMIGKALDLYKKATARE